MARRPNRFGCGACGRRGFAAGGSAFTLLELIVVITIIAILAGVFLPRLTGQAQRATEAEAAAVQRLVTAAAERASLVGGQRMAIEYSTTDGIARLAVVSRLDAADIIPKAGSLRGVEWKPDALVEAVTLERLEIKQAAIDGRRLDTRKWLAPFGAGQVRPTLTIVLAPKGTETTTAYRVDLEADAAVATRTSMPVDQLGIAGSRTMSAGPPNRAIDLDATGRGDSPW